MGEMWFSILCMIPPAQWSPQPNWQLDPFGHFFQGLRS